MNNQIQMGVFVHLAKYKRKPHSSDEYYGVRVEDEDCSNNRWIVLTQNEIEHLRDMQISGITDVMKPGRLYKAGEGLCGTQNYCAKVIYNDNEIIAFLSDHLYRLSNERGERIKDEITSMF